MSSDKKLYGFTLKQHQVYKADNVQKIRIKVEMALLFAHK